MGALSIFDLHFHLHVCVLFLIFEKDISYHTIICFKKYEQK